MLINIFFIVAFGCIVGSLLFCALYVILDFKIKTIGRKFILIACILLIISIINFNIKTEVCSVNEKYTKSTSCENGYTNKNRKHDHYIVTNSYGKELDICSENHIWNSDTPPSKIRILYLRINRLKIFTFYLRKDD